MRSVPMAFADDAAEIAYQEYQTLVNYETYDAWSVKLVFSVSLIMLILELMSGEAARSSAVYVITISAIQLALYHLLEQRTYLQNRSFLLLTSRILREAVTMYNLIVNSRTRLASETSISFKTFLIHSGVISVCWNTATTPLPFRLRKASHIACVMAYVLLNNHAVCSILHNPMLSWTFTSTGSDLLQSPNMPAFLKSLAALATMTIDSRLCWCMISLVQLVVGLLIPMAFMRVAEYESRTQFLRSHFVATRT